MAKISAYQGKVSAATFDAAMPRFPKLSDKGRAVARAILVDGNIPAEVARANGVSRQRACYWASYVFDNLVPEGWQARMITLPAPEMARVIQMERDARERLLHSPQPEEK